MSSDEKQAIREMKGIDLANFLQEKGASLSCPECGKDDMLVQADGPDEPLYVFQLLADHPPEQKGSSASLYAMFCMNCGSCRTFAARTVVQWKQAKEPSGE